MIRIMLKLWINFLVWVWVTWLIIRKSAEDCISIEEVVLPLPLPDVEPEEEKVGRKRKSTTPLEIIPPMEPELESSEQSEDEFEFRVPAYEGILDERENNADQEPARVPLAGIQRRYVTGTRRRDIRWDV